MTLRKRICWIVMTLDHMFFLTKIPFSSVSAVLYHELAALASADS